VDQRRSEGGILLMAQSTADVARCTRGQRPHVRCGGHGLRRDPDEVEAWESERPWDSAAHASNLVDLYDLDAAFFSTLAPDLDPTVVEATEFRSRSTTMSRAAGPAPNAVAASADAPPKGKSGSNAGLRRPSTKRKSPAGRRQGHATAKSDPTQPPDPGAARLHQQTSSLDGPPALIRLAVDVTLLEAGPLALAIRLAGVPDTETPPGGDRSAMLIAAVVLALAEIGPETRAALGVLELLEQADALGIGLAIGRSSREAVFEIGRLLEQAGVSVTTNDDMRLAANALAGMDAETCDALARAPGADPGVGSRHMRLWRSEPGEGRVRRCSCLVDAGGRLHPRPLRLVRMESTPRECGHHHRCPSR